MSLNFEDTGTKYLNKQAESLKKTVRTEAGVFIWQ